MYSLMPIPQVKWDTDEISTVAICPTVVQLYYRMSQDGSHVQDPKLAQPTRYSLD